MAWVARIGERTASCALHHEPAQSALMVRGKPVFSYVPMTFLIIFLCSGMGHYRFTSANQQTRLAGFPYLGG